MRHRANHIRPAQSPLGQGPAVCVLLLLLVLLLVLLLRGGGRQDGSITRYASSGKSALVMVDWANGATYPAPLASHRPHRWMWHQADHPLGPRLPGYSRMLPDQQERPEPSPPSAQQGLKERGQGVGKRGMQRGGWGAAHASCCRSAPAGPPSSHPFGSTRDSHPSFGCNTCMYSVRSRTPAASAGVAVVLQDAHALLLPV